MIAINAPSIVAALSTIGAVYGAYCAIRWYWHQHYTIQVCKERQEIITLLQFLAETYQWEDDHWEMFREYHRLAEKAEGICLRLGIEIRPGEEEDEVEAQENAQ